MVYKVAPLPNPIRIKLVAMLSVHPKNLNGASGLRTRAIAEIRSMELVIPMASSPENKKALTSKEKAFSPIPQNLEILTLTAKKKAIMASRKQNTEMIIIRERTQGL